MFHRKKNKSKQESTKNTLELNAAQDWYYDRYQIQTIMANRWQLAFWIQLIFSFVLIIALLCLLPLKSWEPIVIQRNSITGEVWIDPARTHYLPKDSSEIESNLVQYIIARETYNPIDATARFQQVVFSSSKNMAEAYENSLDSKNSNSVASILGSKGTRTVKVEDVVFLDKTETVSGHHSQHTAIPKLAKVDFKTIDTVGETTIEHDWVATISWDYLGTPTEKEAAWINWNGFTVTDYRVDQRNL